MTILNINILYILLFGIITLVGLTTFVCPSIWTFRSTQL